MPGITAGSGWGLSCALVPVTFVDGGGVERVLPNNGVGRQIIAGDTPIRLTKLSWRVDLSPDVAPGTVVSPTWWRLLVIRKELSKGSNPTDFTAYQSQAFAAGAFPAIPLLLASAAPDPVLWDEWLDLSASPPDPGLNQIAFRDFADGGPEAGVGETLSCLLLPVITTLSQAAPGAANALITIAAYGTKVYGEQSVGRNAAGLPRYAVPHSGA